MAKTRQQWFDDAKYGLFIHWDCIPSLQVSTKEEKQIVLQSGSRTTSIFR